VTPLLQYSAARNIFSVIPSPVAHILELFPQLTWNKVPDNVFSSHLCRFDDVTDPGDAFWIVSRYTTPWWIGNNTIPNECWQWDEIIASCVFHHQHWIVSIILDFVNGH
jgi:hypothetical protein